jgi:hypothetical protein
MKRTQYALSAIKFFGFSNKDIALGLGHIKKLLPERYEEKLKQAGPNAHTLIKDIKIRYKLVKNLKVMPETLSNINRRIEITKGYKTVSEIDLPLGWKI